MIKKTFREMLMTQILSALTVMICMFVDSVMIGRFLGVDAMTAYGLTNPVLLVFAAIGAMLSAGIQVMCGKTIGRGDREATNECFSIAVIIVGAVSFLGLLIVVLFASPICTALGAGRAVAGNDVFYLTKDYLIGFIVGAPAFLFAQTMVPFLQIAGQGLRIAVAVIFMTVFDIIFDILNVFVFHGGMLGMGLASSLSYYIAFAAGISYFFMKKSMYRLRIHSLRLRMFRKLLRYGIPTLINQVSTVFLIYFTNQVLLRVGHNLAVASYSVINTIANICYCGGAGIGSVALMLSSVFYSDDDRESLGSVVRTMVRYSLIINIAVIAFVMIFAPGMVGLFLRENAQATEMAVTGTRLFSLSLIFCSLNTSFKNFYQGTGRTVLTNLISFMQSFLSKIAIVVILSAIFGTDGVWYSWLIGEMLTFAMVSVIVWIKKGKISFTEEAYSLLPASVGANDKDRIDCTVRSIGEAMEASENAYAFCVSHGESRRSSTLISLCIEEMVCNIVRHGFTKDKRRDHEVNIRILFKDGKGLIRLRDNCVHFDPVSYMDLHKADEPTDHIGIRMVMEMVKEADYVSSLGLNNLTLVI